MTRATSELPLGGASYPQIAHAKPICRWVGGKRWAVKLLSTIVYQHVRKTSGRYFEPFLGGGAVAADLGLPDMQLSDVCEPLIHTLSTSVRYPSDVYWVLDLLKKRGTDKDTYYEVRSEEPRGDVLRAARFLYLNALGFNGVWRVNGDGKYNVPYGDGKGTFVDYDRIWLFAEALRSSRIRHEDFRIALVDARDGDIIYADPPYYGVYGSYVKGGFSDKDQADLARALQAARDRGVAFLTTNRDCPEVRHLYIWASFVNTEEHRSVNRDGGGRGKTRCLLITSSPELLHHVEL